MSQMSKNYVLINSSSDSCTGIFCNVCDFLLRDADDMDAYRTWRACHTCYLKFIEARKDAWKEGWRPKEKDIEELYKEKSRLFIK